MDCEVVCEVVVSWRSLSHKPIAPGHRVRCVIVAIATEPRSLLWKQRLPRESAFQRGAPRGDPPHEDGWQRVRVFLHALSAKEFWVAPSETVS